MKKVICLLLAGLLVAGSAWADYNGSDPKKQIKTYIKATGVSAGVGTTQLVPAGTIATDDRIIGLTITPLESGKGAVVGLYDTTTLGTCSTSTIFIELEAGVDGETETFIFPYPKKVSNQVYILIGGSEAIVAILYEDVS